jgi:predicted acetyltransferase
MHIRPLTLDDHDSSIRLSVEAFGSSPGWTPPPRPETLPTDRHVVGAFEDGPEGEELVARMAAHEYESWWHGQRIRTCGIAGVAVAAEHRGDGLIGPLLGRVLADGANRGAPLSTLYPTATGIYRPFGYEVVSSYDTVEVTMADLARARPPTGTRTRRARLGDVPAVRGVYDAWSAAQNGPLTRTGPRFTAPDAELLEAFTALTVAVDESDRVVGFVSWDRGSGYGDSATGIVVHDLLATTLDGYRALWLVLASHSSVVGRVRLSTSGHDPARLALASSTWTVVQRHPYMLRVDDPAAALAAARPALPGLARTEIGFAVAGDRLGRSDGSYRLTVGAEPGVCERVEPASGVPVLTPQGLALLYAGVQSCANLRMLGHLTGPAEHDRVLDALLGSRPAHVRDYF